MKEFKYIITDKIQYSNYARIIDFGTFEEIVNNLPNPVFIILFYPAPTKFITEDESGKRKFINLSKEQIAFIKENKIDIEDFDQLNDIAVVKEGFIYIYHNFNGYRDIESYKIGSANGYLFGSIYYKSKKLGFNEYTKYKEYINSGYQTKEDYLKGLELEFKSSNDFYDAERKGFSNSSDYYVAVKLNISSISFFNLYEELNKVSIELNLKFLQEANFKKFLEGLHSNKIISISKLYEEFIKFEQELGLLQPDGKKNKYLSWYSQMNLLSPKNLIPLLENKSLLNGIGFFENEGETFHRHEYKRFKNKKILVDGSNVCWEGKNSKKNEKPEIKNLYYVIEKLTTIGFEEIIIIIDASLKHQIRKEDMEMFEKFLAENKIQEVPAKSDADKLLISYAKKEKEIHIVSNDLFRNHSSSDEWLKINYLEKIRVPYVVNDEQVSFLKFLE